MPKTIHKYTLPNERTFALLLPVGAEILDVQHQRYGGEELGAFVLWCVVDPEERISETRLFERTETGGGLADSVRRRHIGTVQVYVLDKPYVLHFFEIEPKERPYR